MKKIKGAFSRFLLIKKVAFIRMTRLRIGFHPGKIFFDNLFPTDPNKLLEWAA
jgi:hypothetical protein